MADENHNSSEPVYSTRTELEFDPESPGIIITKLTGKTFLTPPTTSLAIVTHVVQLCVHILPTAPPRSPIVDIHVHRHLEILLAHVLTVPAHCLILRLDHTHLLLFHLPLLPVELESHLERAIEVLRHIEAYLVVPGMRRLLLRIGRERPHFTIFGADSPAFHVRRVSLLPPGTPFGVCLPYLFLLGPLEFLTYVAALAGRPVPVRVVSIHIRWDALVSFTMRAS